MGCKKYKILAFHVKFCKMKSMKILHDQFAIQVIAVARIDMSVNQI